MQQPSPSRVPKRVLVVEDAALMFLVIKRLLSFSPYVEVVGHATDGKDALSKLEETKPDLILLDLEMPGMGGLDFLKHVRMRSRAKIVVLSSVATAGSENARQAKRLGADAVIAKPSGSVSMDLQEARGTALFDTIYGLLGIR